MARDNNISSSSSSNRASLIGVSFSLRKVRDRREIRAHITNFPVFSGQFKDIRETCDAFKTALKNPRLRPRDFLASRRALVNTMTHLAHPNDDQAKRDPHHGEVQSQRSVEEVALLIEYYTFECLVLYTMIWGKIRGVSESLRFEFQCILDSNPVYMAWTRKGKAYEETQMLENGASIPVPFSVSITDVVESGEMCERLWYVWQMDKFLSIIVEETPQQLLSFACPCA